MLVCARTIPAGTRIQMSATSPTGLVELIRVFTDKGLEPPHLTGVNVRQRHPVAADAIDPPHAL